VSDLVDPLLEVFERQSTLLGRSMVKLRNNNISVACHAALPYGIIAQSCLDHDVELVTRDVDFRYFARLAGLRLFPAASRRT